MYETQHKRSYEPCLMVLSFKARAGGSLVKIGKIQASARMRIVQDCLDPKQIPI